MGQLNDENLINKFSNLPHKAVLGSENLGMDEERPDPYANFDGKWNPSHSGAEHSSHPSQKHEQFPGVGRDMHSANFFQMSGIPKFGKHWLDNFIPD